MTTVQFLYLLIIERDLQPTDWCSFMEKDYLRISSTVLVSLLFGLALVLVNSWFNQPGVEEVVPRSTW
ncbi:MASE4 domain-containing protein, partial [Shigella flexneri]